MVREAMQLLDPELHKAQGELEPLPPRAGVS